MASGDLMDPAVIEALFACTPGGVTVRQGGVTTYGHFEHVPGQFGDQPGVLTSEPTLVIASGGLPGVGLDDTKGRARGIGTLVEVEGDEGPFTWKVRAVEPGVAPGEIRVLLANR